MHLRDTPHGRLRVMKDPNPILPDRPWLVLQAVRKGGAAHWATLHLAETAQAAWAWLTLFPADPAPATGDDIQCHDNTGGPATP